MYPTHLQTPWPRRHGCMLLHKSCAFICLIKGFRSRKLAMLALAPHLTLQGCLMAGQQSPVLKVKQVAELCGHCITTNFFRDSVNVKLH